MFQLESLTKVRVLDVRVLASKNRKPDDPPGGQILLSANLPAAQLAMFDGFLPGVLFRKAAGESKNPQLDGMEGMELTPIGDHIKKVGWQYEQTGCRVVIDYGAGGPSNIDLQDCKVHRVSFSPRDGGSVVVQWTIDVPGLEGPAWAKLPNLKATDIQMTMVGPEVDDSQADIEDPPAKRGKAKRSNVIDGTVGHPGAAAQQDGKGGGPWPFGDKGANNAPNVGSAAEASADAATEAFLGIHADQAGGPPDSDTDGGASDSEGGETDVSAAEAAEFEEGAKKAIRGRGRGRLAAVE